MNPCFWCSLWRCGEKKLLVANCLSIFGFDIYDTWKVSNEPPLQFNRQKKTSQTITSLKLEKYTFEKRPSSCFLKQQSVSKNPGYVAESKGTFLAANGTRKLKKMMLQKKKTKTLPSELLLGGDAKGANYPNIITNHQRTPRHSDRRYVTTTSRFVLVFILYI